MRLIINADDFGMTPGVTAAILHAMVHGIVTSTTMMVNMHGTEEAARLVQDGTVTAVGLHINVTLGKPLTDCPSLTQRGYFIKPKNLPNDDRYDPEQLDQELEAQFTRFCLLTGTRPTHLDSHLYAHQKFPKVQAAVLRLAEKKNLPVRGFATRQHEKAEFIGDFKVLPGETAAQLQEKLITVIEREKQKDVAELMVHPGWADRWLMENSGYNLQRTLEHSVLTSERTIAYLEQAAVETISFRDME